MEIAVTAGLMVPEATLRHPEPPLAVETSATERRPGPPVDRSGSEAAVGLHLVRTLTIIVGTLGGEPGPEETGESVHAQ